MNAVVGEPKRFLISDLCEHLEHYLPEDAIREIYSAYLFGAEAHEGQYRVSGEPYIYHPIAVAKILSDMRMDKATLIAAILHDVIEDTHVLKEDIVKNYGSEVAELVDGVSKLTKVKFKSKAEQQAENFRKMLFAMSRDIRIIIIKLADRLHNLRTLGSMPAHKQHRIGKQTLEIYAPIAHRLGIHTIKLELEELSFRAAYPRFYRRLVKQMQNVEMRQTQQYSIAEMRHAVETVLQQEQLNFQLITRQKHVYSLYCKYKHKQSLNVAYNVHGLRIIVETVNDCYLVLGLMHRLYKPQPGRFKDYIAIPKINGYQALHTVLVSPWGNIDIQIRSQEMNKIAEVGIVSHWLYCRESSHHDYPDHIQANRWLNDLLTMQENSDSTIEFIENVKVDLFPNEVYVFSPAGEIFKLPRGATMVDFAYAVHTDVGNTCLMARADSNLVPLQTPVQNGQTIEITTTPGAKPNPAWLNFVITAKARSNIRTYLRRSTKGDAIQLGRRLLKKELSYFDLDVDNLATVLVEQIVNDYHLSSLDDLFADIGLGRQLAPLVARRFSCVNDATIDNSQPLVICGTEGAVINFAHCCYPIPDDPIVAFVVEGVGLKVHHANCRYIWEQKQQHPSERWLDIEWSKQLDNREFITEIRVYVVNQRGVLARVAGEISREGSNIENVHNESLDGHNSLIILTITVLNRLHLANIMRRIRAIPAVVKIVRTRGFVKN